MLLWGGAAQEGVLLGALARLHRVVAVSLPAVAPDAPCLRSALHPTQTPSPRGAQGTALHQACCLLGQFLLCWRFPSSSHTCFTTSRLKRKRKTVSFGTGSHSSATTPFFSFPSQQNFSEELSGLAISISFFAYSLKSSQVIFIVVVVCRCVSFNILATNDLHIATSNSKWHSIWPITGLLQLIIL